MEKIYRYRKHIKIIYIITIVMFVICVILSILSAAFVPETIPAGLLLSAIFGFELFLYRRISSTTIAIREDGLHYQNVAKSRVVPYEDIKKIDSSSLRFMGGWMSIIPYEGKPIRLTVVVEGIGELIIALKNKMDEHQLQDRYEEPKLFAFFQTAFYSDQSWRRSGRFMPVYLVTLLVQMFVAIFWILATDKLIWILAMIVPIAIGLAPFLYVEYGIYAKEIKKNEAGPVWEVLETDRDLERKRVRFVTWFYVAVAMLGIAIPSLIVWIF